MHELRKALQFASYICLLACLLKLRLVLLGKINNFPKSSLRFLSMPPWQPHHADSLESSLPLQGALESRG